MTCNHSCSVSMAIPWLDIVLAHIGNHFEREVTSYTSATSQISSVHDFFSGIFYMPRNTETVCPTHEGTTITIEGKKIHFSTIMFDICRLN